MIAKGCGYSTNLGGAVHVTNGGGVATATANSAMELPFSLAVRTHIVPDCAGCWAGHMNLQCSVVPGCEAASALAGAADPPVAQIIQSPLRDRGATSSKVASLRSMTVAETMNKRPMFCQGLFRVQGRVQLSQETLEVRQMFAFRRDLVCLVDKILAPAALDQQCDLVVE